MRLFFLTLAGLRATPLHAAVRLPAPRLDMNRPSWSLRSIDPLVVVDPRTKTSLSPLPRRSLMPGAPSLDCSKEQFTSISFSIEEAQK